MKTYQSVIIHPDVAGGRCGGEINITTNEIVFSSSEIEYKIALKHLSLTAGGAGNRFVFLKDNHQELISIYTADKSILKDSAIISNKLLSQDLAQSKKILNKSFLGIYISLGVLVAFLLSLYFFRNLMVENIAKHVPQSWEKTAGDKLFATLALQYHFVKHDSLKKEFLKVGAPLFSQIEKEGYNIDLYFVKDPTINAFALPGGKVIIQTGLIQNAQSWEEVLGVLGHELAHVSRRHHIRGIVNNVGIFALLTAVSGDVSAIAAMFAQFGGELASLANSRDFENEADETGLQYLENAKINPAGMISFFETLKKETSTTLDSTLNSKVDLSFLSTHPNTQDRIDNLKKQAGKIHDTAFVVLPANFASFKHALLNIKE